MLLSLERVAPTLFGGLADKSRPCRCGHAGEAHEHYRRGTDCALCDCLRYQR